MKDAFHSFTRYLVKELGGHGIHRECCGTGSHETDMNHPAIRNNPQMKSILAAQTALGRVGEPNEIGGVVDFLCLENAGWVNAQRIEVSGGRFI